MAKVKEWFDVRFVGQAKEYFNVDGIQSEDFKRWVDACADAARTLIVNNLSLLADADYGIDEHDFHA